MTTQPFSPRDVCTERPFAGDSQRAAFGRPSLLTVAFAAAADHIAHGPASGAAQPVLRGEPTFED